MEYKLHLQGVRHMSLQKLSLEKFGPISKSAKAFGTYCLNISTPFLIFHDLKVVRFIQIDRRLWWSLRRSDPIKTM